MGRTVAQHPYQIVTAFTHVEQDEDFSCWEWEELMSNWREQMQEFWPSLTRADSWEHRECRIIAENQHCKVSVSEYCGLVAICLIPKVDDPATMGMAYRWCQSIAPKFKEEFSTLRHIGSASNGEAFFQEIAA